MLLKNVFLYFPHTFRQKTFEYLIVVKRLTETDLLMTAGRKLLAMLENTENSLRKQVS